MLQEKVKYGKQRWMHDILVYKSAENKHEESKYNLPGRYSQEYRHSGTHFRFFFLSHLIFNFWTGNAPVHFPRDHSGISLCFLIQYSRAHSIVYI